MTMVDPDNPTGNRPASTSRPPTTAPATAPRPPSTGAPAGTGYDSGAWGANLTNVGVAPQYQASYMRFAQNYSPYMPWATATWYSSMLSQFEASAAQRALFQQYGNRYLDIWTDYLIKHPEDPNWLHNQMMANGIDATKAKALFDEFNGSGGRGPGGGGGGVSKAQQFAAAEAAIRNQVMTYGHVTFGEDRIKATARQAVNNNWSADQLTDFLVNDARANWDKLQGGSLKGAVDQIKTAAAQQLLRISDETAKQWSLRLATQEIDQSGLDNMIQEQAMARFSWAADSLKKGVRMADLLAPSRDRIAEVLELAPEKVDLLDPKMLGMVTVRDDKGQTRLANDDEVIRAARQDSRWMQTRNARQLATSAATMLRDYMEGRA